MKQTLLLLAVIFSLNATAQFVRKEDGIKIKPYKYPKDTIRVIMAVSDTNNRINASVYWVYGYEVREIHSELEGSIDWYMDHQRPPENYYVHDYYLNSKKKKLFPSIIVWQSNPL